MGKIALNYIYLSKKHAGGKDQVGLNLLKGFYELGVSKNLLVICFDYSEQIIKKIAPDIEVIALKSIEMNNELKRMAYTCWIETTQIPKMVKDYEINVLFHLNCNNGLRKLKCKSIVIPHDIKAVAHRVLADVKIPFYKYILYKVMYFLDFSHADCIIAISEFDKSEITTQYQKYARKVKRIYNPITTTEMIKKNDTSNYICALNLQFHHKNIITLIKAFERIKDITDYKLILIGNVPNRVSYLKEYVKEKKLESCIKFTGFISDEELYELFVNSKLYVNPTLYEGFGMTAVEAMILQVPTLVSNIKANVEVTKGLCDYYGPAEDDKALANKILECLNKDYTKDYLQHCSKAMVDEYNYINISKQYYELFREMEK